MIHGREFSRRDQRASLRSSAAESRRDGADKEVPAVINQTAATRLFETSDPIGRRLRQEKNNYVVIGVVRDVKSGILMSKPVPTVFLPLTATTFSTALTEGTVVVLRGTVGSDIIAAARTVLASMDPDLTIFNARTLTEGFDEFNQLIRWSSAMNGGLGLFGLILACIGLSGVTAHAVARRHKEIGIRMALGATGRQVLRLVLRECVILVLVGSVFGLVGAFALSRVFSAITDVLAQIFEVGTADPLLVVGAPVLLASLALLASYLPARRSTRIDPLSALRQE